VEKEWRALFGAGMFTRPTRREFIMQAIGYVRRSTEKQEMSLDQQRAKLEQFAGAKGWKLVRVFEDDAVSGSDMKRPGLDEMLAFAKRS
jgi:DNA invertase Pin-like site-specific DNA recombinase